MDNKNLNKPEHLKAEVWRQHLHWIDLLNRQADENYAKNLARLKEESRRSKALLQSKHQLQQNAEPTQGPFWITEE